MKKNDKVSVEFLQFLLGYKVDNEIEDLFEETIIKIYDLNKPINVSIFILSVFHYLDYIENNYIKEKLGKGFEIPNKFLFILNFYLNLFRALDFENDINNRLNSCKNDNDYLRIIANLDDDILNYFVLSYTNLTMNFRRQNEEEMEKLLKRLQKEAERFINDKTIYNKLPKNIKKLYSRVVHSE